MRRKSIKISLVIMAGFLIIYPTHSQGNWVTKNISGGGYYNSIAIDPSGYPHISYLDDSDPANHFLKHAFFDGKKWNIEVVDEGDIHWLNAIAVDSVGHIHIAYQADGLLTYAYFDGTEWNISPLGTGGGISSSIAVDRDNYPHISYVRPYSILEYVRYDGNSWIFETIPVYATGWERTSIALTPSGKAHITACNLDRELVWANNVSGNWDVNSVDYGTESSIALDSLGHPHIAYRQGGGSLELKYARFDGASWQIQVVTDDFGLYGQKEYPSLKLDSQDHPHICFGLFDWTIGLIAVSYIYFDGEEWFCSLIDGNNASFPSLALDEGGLPHVSYRVYPSDANRLNYRGRLKYAYLEGVTLKVSKMGKGTGTVVSTPPAISCGSICEDSYLPGTSVSLQAIPDPDSGFEGWIGCTSDPDNPTKCTVIVDKNISVKAEFSKYTLKVIKIGKNKATGNIISIPPGLGIDCGDDCIESYPTGTFVSLQAIPDPDSGFEGWIGCTSDPGDPTKCTVIMDKNISVKGKFSKYTLKVIKMSTKKGTGSVASVDPGQGIDCGSDCTESYPFGTFVTIEAHPDSGSDFGGWSGACSGTDLSCTVTLIKNITVRAKFAKF